MRGPFLLLLHSLRRVRALVLTTAILLGGFQMLLILVARSIQSSGGFEQFSSMIPAFARELTGPGFMSFTGTVCLGYFHPVVMGSLVAMSIALATTPTSEIETGFIDLLLSRPLARHWIITRTIIATALSTAILLGAMTLGTWIGLVTLAPKDAAWPPEKLIISLAINLYLLALCWTGVALAIGSASQRRSAAGSIAGLLALVTFLLDYLGRLWKPAQPAARLSPFHFYTPFEIIMGDPLPLKNLVVLGVIASAGIAAGYVLFSRRDISH